MAVTISAKALGLSGGDGVNPGVDIGKFTHKRR